MRPGALLRLALGLSCVIAFADGAGLGVAAPAAASAKSTGGGMATAPDTTRAPAPSGRVPPGHPEFSAPAPQRTAAQFKIVVPPGSPRVRAVTLEVRHRVFPDFAEADSVSLREWFQIGDTPFSAIVTHFVPDFAIDVSARKITSRSTEPRNPALRLIVRENGVPTDTTWAFLNSPPHFARKSMLAFRILRIDFADRPPLLPDTSSAGKTKP